MAIDAGMLAFRPLFVRLIMHMAGKACIRVIFEIIIDLVRCKEHGEGKEKEDAHDDYAGFCGNSLAEPGNNPFDDRNRIEHQQIPPQQPAALFIVFSDFRMLLLLLLLCLFPNAQGT